MVIRWDSESDWKNSQDSSGTTGRNGNLRQGYSRERPDLSSDLVSYWPLHDDSATDYSGNNNHGSLNGGVTTGVAGKGGLQAMSFDGNDDYVRVNSGSVLQPTRRFSVSLWIKPENFSSSDVDYIIARAGDSDTSDFFSLYIDKSGYIVAQILDDSVSNNYSFTVSSSSEIKLNQWTQITVSKSWDGSQSEMKLFIDGSMVDSSTDSNPLDGQSNTSNPIRIGENPYGPVYYDGSAGDIRIYNRALSNSEIQTLYEWGSGDYARPPNDSNGGVSYYPLDGNADDQWGINDGTNNGVSFVNDSIRGKAGKFNGSGDIISFPGGIVNQPDQYTMSAWAKFNDPNNGSRDGVLILRENQDIYIRTDGSGSAEFVHAASSSDQYRIFEPISSNDWYLLNLTWDGNQTRAYVNSELVGTKSVSTHSSGNWSTDIGGNSAYSGNYMDGLIDDVRIYNRAFSQREIFQLYRWGSRGRDMRKQLVNY